MKRIVQLLPAIRLADERSDDCLAIHGCLTAAGYDCRIYAGEIDPRLKEKGIPEIHPIADFPDDAEIVICHVYCRWDFLRTLERLNGRKILRWHGMPPPRTFDDYGDTQGAGSSREGLEQAGALHLLPSLCLATSPSGRADLQKMRYRCPIHILPLLSPSAVPAAAPDTEAPDSLLSRYRADGFVNILSVGGLLPSRKLEDSIAAFYCYKRDINPKSRLFLVSEGAECAEYRRALQAYPAALGLADVFFTGVCTDEQKTAYYRLADLFLCMDAREGFRPPLLEAMRHRLPIIASDSDGMRESLGGAGLLLGEGDPHVVAEAIHRVVTDRTLRDRLVSNADEHLAACTGDRMKARLSAELSRFIGYWNRERTLYFDITSQRTSADRTGIPRLENEELKRLYEAAGDYKTVPFYFDEDGKGLFECETGQQIQPQAGDIIYSPDLSLDGTVANRNRLDELYRRKGVRIWFFVHDLTPIRFPETCSDLLIPRFTNWLKVIFRYTGIVGNSKATIDDVRAWLGEHPEVKRSPDLRLDWVWLGGDFSSPRAGGQEVKPAQERRKSRTVRLLMVSTVEPRKMYDQAVWAFDLLTAKGLDLRLDIVGKKGWKAEGTAALIEGSPQYDERLFWHREGIGDEELDGLYRAADAVIVASKWEGFGMAVTEGAYHGKPLILRDIPVFHEIAGDNAFYFSGYEPEDLAAALEEWLALFMEGNAPSSGGIQLTSWQEHTDKLLAILTES